MATAMWNGAILAESDDVQIVEGNVYFPPDALDRSRLVESESHTRCPWKGTASYYHIEVDGEVNRDAAWYYADPKPKASGLKDHVAFWRGVEVSE